MGRFDTTGIESFRKDTLKGFENFNPDSQLDSYYKPAQCYDYDRHQHTSEYKGKYREVGVHKQQIGKYDIYKHGN